jgi:hypothetical protein
MDRKRRINITAGFESARQRYFPDLPIDFPENAGWSGRRACTAPCERGNGDVVDIADRAVVRRASANDAAGKRAQIAAPWPHDTGFTPLSAVPEDRWHALAERAVEPNGYYLPAWELAVNASARGRTSVSGLSAWRKTATPD